MGAVIHRFTYPLFVHKNKNGLAIKCKKNIK